MKKAAVVLCGSGFMDGTEIREAVGVLYALSEVGIEAHCFALDEPQFDVINCLNNEVSSEKRNQMVEAVCSTCWTLSGTVCNGEPYP